MYMRSARREPELPKVPALYVAAAPYKGCALAPLRGYPLSLRKTTAYHNHDRFAVTGRAVNFYHQIYKEANHESQT